MEEEVAAASSQQQTEQRTQQQQTQQTEPSVSSPPKLPTTFPGPNTVLVNVSGTRYSVGELQIQIMTTKLFQLATCILHTMQFLWLLIDWAWPLL